MMCCLCLGYRTGDARTAVTVIHGYAVCGEHFHLAPRDTRDYRLTLSLLRANGDQS